MLAKKLPGVTLSVISLFLSLAVVAQNKVVTGKVTDSKDGTPVIGASVVAKGSTTGTSTNSEGNFTLSVPANVSTVIITSVGYGRQEITIGADNKVAATLESVNQDLNAVVVVGYGTARKKDLTGSVASIQAKDFNKGPTSNPDQLLQGKVAGLQVINSSGQPGAATIVKIRGSNSIRSGNTPLYVIDGIPLDGRSARPGLNNSGLGNTPDANPLLYINPNDIASIDVLKDASASAIYGSRGANGVILVTTKKGQSGPAKIEVAAVTGVASVMRKIKMLDANGYRNALNAYNAPKSDSGASIDPFKEITNKGAVTQNYSVAFSGGGENGKYRASFLYADQEGIIRKTGLRKYVANFNAQHRFIDNKLSLDFNLTAANTSEKLAPISNDAGSAGNIISLALIWNPTLVLQRPNGLYNQVNPSGQTNPLALSQAYNDITSQTVILASASAGYKITKELEYRMLLGLNYETGSRKQEIMGWIVGFSGPTGGGANVSNSKLFSQTVTHTLNYNKKLSPNLSLNALAGYEFWKTGLEGNQTFVSKFNLNQTQFGVLPDYHYYDNMQAGDQANLRTASFKDPSVELQSYFARAAFNYDDKYLLTATFRADGSSKFGKNNKYAYFPSIAAAWNITNEDFMKSNTLFDNLKLRIGYGQTGNQEFNPVDAALPVGIYNGYNSLSSVHFANPDLKWETVSSIDAGVDFSLLKGRIFGAIDYFSKRTNDPILAFTVSQPTAGGTIFKNLDGSAPDVPKAWVTNKGVEFTIGGTIVDKKDIQWNLVVNTTFVKNRFNSPDAASLPFVVNTGGLHGQGSSGAYAEVIADGQPLDVFYLPTFLGFDKGSGLAQYTLTPDYSGDPNPNLFLGVSTDVTYKAWSLTINTHGSFGNKIFNNTSMSVTNINNIVGGRNIREGLVGNGESTSNFITPSTRFLESGNYIKFGNATINYKFGKLGSVIRAANVYLTGTNLFVISKYKGFDPEVNVDKTLNGVPSLGIDYIGYPSARTIVLGLNFSL